MLKPERWIWTALFLAGCAAGTGPAAGGDRYAVLAAPAVGAASTADEAWFRDPRYRQPTDAADVQAAVRWLRLHVITMPAYPGGTSAFAPMWATIKRDGGQTSLFLRGVVATLSASSQVELLVRHDATGFRLIWLRRSPG